MTGEIPGDDIGWLHEEMTAHVEADPGIKLRLMALGADEKTRFMLFMNRILTIEEARIEGLSYLPNGTPSLTAEAGERMGLLYRPIEEDGENPQA